MGKIEPHIGLDPELLAQAKRLGLSVAGMDDRALRLKLQKLDPAGAEDRARRWAEENAEVIAESNRFVAEHGAFGAKWRSW